ncbi:MAG: DUF4349 domain-containing protein [Nocardioidaceae bacterium]|nr:DUF4349 domain-containing protein [Nocardioidaceae bacterium]MCL2612415.1 DUF4349 domain-containing protein [Nocardioidaceae bacterium]
MAAAAGVIGLLAVGGCGTAVGTGSASSPTPSAAGGDAHGSLSGLSANAGAAPRPFDSVRDVAARQPAGPPAPGRALIRTGRVTLTSDDVAHAAGGVRRVAGADGGSIAGEQDRAKRGRLVQARLTVRVPSRHFGAALASIKRLGTLVSAASSTDDVTTQVIDVGVRVRAERASVRRVEQLMGRARSLNQVIAIEGQLTRRREALESLERQQAYLKDQTSMSTITVVVAASHAARARHTTTHRSGFIGGLHNGWHALTVMVTALATGLGAAVPFGVPLLVVGLVVWFVLRRRRTT